MKAQQLLDHMHKMYREGNVLAKPDTITVSYLYILQDLKCMFAHLVSLSVAVQCCHQRMG